MLIENHRENILEIAKGMAQTSGYNGINFREIAAKIGIKSASIHYHFPKKADLGAAVARRYWEDTKVTLDSIKTKYTDPLKCLKKYPDIFRKTLEVENRICLCTFMSAEMNDLPEEIKQEVQTFAEVNIDWLKSVLMANGVISPKESEQRARGIFSAIMGAQIMAKSRANPKVFDSLIETYRTSGLIPS